MMVEDMRVFVWEQGAMIRMVLFGGGNVFLLLEMMSLLLHLWDMELARRDTQWMGSYGDMGMLWDRGLRVYLIWLAGKRQ